MSVISGYLRPSTFCTNCGDPKGLFIARKNATTRWSRCRRCRKYSEGPCGPINVQVVKPVAG